MSIRIYFQLVGACNNIEILFKKSRNFNFNGNFFMKIFTCKEIIDMNNLFHQNFLICLKIMKIKLDDT
jgi:hypothetical protein